jgi:hypothetical protein
MKLLITTTTVALSFAAAAAAMAATAPTAPRASVESASPPAQSSPMQYAGGRRGKCTENLGYGRTGTYGCG